MQNVSSAPSEHSRSITFSLNTIIFIIMHLLPLLAVFTHVTAFDWILAVALYVVRMFFVTAGYHRYFSHRTFKTSRWFQALLAFFASTSVQKGALWWASHHRVHHKHSDTELDPHSKKVYGFWESHVGWILSTLHEETKIELVKDLTKFRELVWLEKFHFIPPILLATFVTILGAYVNNNSGMSTLLISFFLSTVVLYHATFSINSVMHWVGKARYDTGDESKNSFILAILSLGEGWHNNHHYYQSSTRQGFFWWEIDLTYYALRLLSLFGIVWELREVPDHVKYDPEKLLKPEPQGV